MRGGGDFSRSGPFQKFTRRFLKWTQVVVKIDIRFCHPHYRTHKMAAAFETFKAKINRVRDILRSDGITGMDSMKHCALYLASRYMKRERVAEFRIPDAFAWESLIALVRSGANSDKELSRDRIYNSAGDCLVSHFDSLFKTTEFMFRTSAIRHADIMEALDPVDLDAIQSDMDLLGWVYEAHMKTNKGSSGGSRDLGQHFTDRSIIKYMVELCAPKLHANGKIETICDPSMGTGGMLTTVVKYMTDKYGMKHADWERNRECVTGCDIDRFLGSVASINVFMETHGTVFPHVQARDSLTNDLPMDADVIIANMPFGVKGLTHAGCCERVKALKINGTKSEPLFLQLMMVSLNTGGRCAVVVPDGMLVNTSTCHNGTRKYLLDHFELKRVIKMKGQFFMNTGIQPSILFFEKTGKPTEAVEFWEVVKSEKGEITETMTVSVPRTKIDASSSLDMRRYLESDKPVANPAGFPMVNISEQCSMMIGGTPLRSKTEYYENGQYVWVSVSELNNKIIMDSKEHINDEGVKHSNVKLVKKGSVLMSFKMSIGKCAIAGIDLYTNEAIVAFYSKDESILSNKYLFYYLSLRDFSNAGKGSIGVGSMNKESLSELTMPLPPLPIQQEIVATLDRIYETSSMTTALSSSVQTQMKELFNSSLKSSDYTYPEISSFCSFEKSKIAATKNVAGEYPFISLKTSMHNAKTLDDSEHVFISGIPQGNRLMKVKFHKGECAYSSLMFHCKLDTTVILPKFFYNYLRYNMDILNEYVVGVQPKFSHESFLTRKLIVPSLTIQQAVLKHLDIMEQSIETFERLTDETDEKAKLVLNLYMSAITPDVVSLGGSESRGSESPTNEIIHPEEEAPAAAPAKKTVKRKKTVAKPASDVITHA